VDGDVIAGEVHATGDVSASGAQIGGDLNLRWAVLVNEAGDALALDRVRVDGEVVAGELHATGMVSASGAQIGHLNLHQAVLANAVADGGGSIATPRSCSLAVSRR
jgi:cytoskeletal protein CcmA (bactofilin family)